MMLLTTRDVAALLKVHPKHVYRLLKRGLPAHRVGDEWRFDEDEVRRYCRARGDEALAPEGAPGGAAEGAPQRRPRVRACEPPGCLLEALPRGASADRGEW